MLVLSRKVGETIDVLSVKGELLARVAIVRVNGNRVVLGLDGQPTIKFLRSEIERHPSARVADGAARRRTSAP